MDNAGVRRFFYERLFASSLRRAFPQFSSSYASLARVRALITDELVTRASVKSDARGLDFNQVRSHVWYLLSADEIHEALCDIIEAEGGSLVGDDGVSVRDRSFYEVQYQDFLECSGVLGGDSSDKFLPLSVLDPRFSHCEAARKAFGEGELELGVEDSFFVENNVSPGSLEVFSNVPVWKVEDRSLVGERYGFINTGKDMHMVSLLSDYVANNHQLDVIGDWMEQGAERFGVMSEFGRERARAVLDFLGN